MLTNNITRLLNQRKVSYNLHDLKSTQKVSAVEVSKLLDLPENQIFKTIILSSALKPGKLIAAFVPSNQMVDTKKLAAILHDKKISPLKQTVAEAKTGMQTGGISPLGLINKPFRIIADESINSLRTVIISAGIRGWQLELAPSDLLLLCKAQTKPITKVII